MIQNIKVDIIYYLMASDFEMEFNLCGCCRMRLLTDKASDKRSLVLDMKRAVSRSRVTMVCGPLFTENGLIEVTAKAVKRELVAVDKSAFKINAEGDLNIIADSVPLVTKDGVFGGLIMESGPQSIILLTDSKSVRKEIMQNLIHPYVEELSLTPEQRGISHKADDTAMEDISSVSEAGRHLDEIPAEETAAEEAATADAVSEESANTAEDEDIIVEEAPETEAESANEAADETLDEAADETAEETADEAVEETADEPSTTAAGEIDFVFPDYDSDEEDEEEEIDPPEFVEDVSGFYIEPKKVSFKAANEYASNYVPSEKDEMFISELEETYDKIKKDKKINVWLIVILATLGVLVLFVVYYLVVLPLASGTDFGTYYNELFGMIE